MKLETNVVAGVNPLNYKRTRLKKIGEEIEVLNHKITSIDETWDFSRSYFEYEEALQPYTDEIEKLDREARLIMDYKLTPIKKGSTVMTLKQFIKNVNCGGFIDYDGSGNYAIGNEESNITIFPSDVEHNSLRTDFNKVVWYNR